MRIFLLALCSIVLVGCATPPPSQQQDSAPAATLDPNSIEDAVPRDEIITRAGNTSPYTVLGKTYTVMDRGDQYIEQGTASWYGTKFHGRPTANGEPYSLYGMTAAHRRLPIPTYVKVTNLENGRTAIVRVNDRGPFHSERIIDLSYAAAVKLGYATQGTARVEIEAIDTRNSPPGADQDAAKYYLQVGAFSDQSRADSLAGKLQTQLELPVAVDNTQDDFHRVWVGPIADLGTVRRVSEQLEQQQLGSPKLIRR